MNGASGTWERVSAPTGGSVTDIAWADAGERALDVFAATPVGVVRTSSRFTQWTSVHAQLLGLVTAVAATPTMAAAMVFAGGRDGLYRSTDRGVTWHHLLASAPVFAIAATPDGTVLAASSQEGILRSDDSGESWAGANAGLRDLTILSLVLSPRFGDDRVGFLGTPTGVYRTRNGGRSWRLVDLGPDEPAVQALAVSPCFPDDQVVFAGTEADGLFRSVDAGATWEPVSAIGERAIAAVATGGNDDTPLVAVASGNLVLLSDDGGHDWRATAPLVAPILTLSFVPDERKERLVAGLVGRGAARLAFDGETWEPVNHGLRAAIPTALSLSPAFAHDGMIFTMSADGVVGMSHDAGRSWTHRLIDPGHIGLGLVLAPDFATDRRAWALTTGGLFRFISRGDAWDPVAKETLPAPPQTMTISARSLLIGAFEGGSIHTSENGGASWRYLGSIPDAGQVGQIVSSAAGTGQPSLFAIVEPAEERGGSSSFILWCSVDHGLTWKRWGDFPGVGANPVMAACGNARELFLIVGAGSRIWSSVVARRGSCPEWRESALGGDRDDGSVTALASASAPVHGPLVFAGTTDGVYVSHDSGQSFADWSDGLDPRAVAALAVSPAFVTDRLIFAVTLGGEVWRRRIT